MPSKMMLALETEEILCSSNVKFNGQPAGIILAETHELANRAAEMVELIYEGKKPESSNETYNLNKYF